MRRSFILFALAVLGTTSPVIAAKSQTVASLKDAQGADSGTATLTQAGGDVKLKVKVTGLPAGVHGIHVHTVGRCDTPDFSTAGSHWNPTGQQHGMQNPAGPHVGDIQNITVRANGSGTLNATIKQGTLSGGNAPMLDADGAALVIHAAPDDYKTDPSGNSGGRIACGVLTAR